MADTFDPYREALVVETQTEWPAEFENWAADRKQQLAERLHQEPQEAAELEYVRTHTGFCRRIVVTPDDVQRLENNGSE